jgi:hypothetical protein
MGELGVFGTFLGVFWWSVLPENEERVQFCTIVQSYQNTSFFRKGVVQEPENDNLLAPPCSIYLH